MQNSDICGIEWIYIGMVVNLGIDDVVPPCVDEQQLIQEVTDESVAHEGDEKTE